MTYITQHYNQNQNLRKYSIFIRFIIQRCNEQINYFKELQESLTDNSVETKSRRARY